jgi:Flp pilus assembly pilin Flp
MIEYAGMVLLVSISVILLLGALGLDVAEVFNKLEDSMGLGADNTVNTTEPGQDDQAPPTGVVP